jgi:hypothetical protein
LPQKRSFALVSILQRRALAKIANALHLLPAVRREEFLHRAARARTVKSKSCSDGSASTTSSIAGLKACTDKSRGH